MFDSSLRYTDSATNFCYKSVKTTLYHEALTVTAIASSWLLYKVIDGRQALHSVLLSMNHIVVLFTYWSDRN